jgi:hypothetical protein
MAKAAVSKKNNQQQAPIATAHVVEIASPAISKSRTWFYELLINSYIFIPVLVYFSVVSSYALNLPILDDYHAVLKFLNDYKGADLTTKVTLLLQQHNEHRILSTRLICAIYYGLTGGINFINLIYIANLQLVVIFIVLTIFIKKAVPKYWGIVSLMAGFCLFDLNNYDNADFAMCGMVNYGVIMLFLMSLLFYSFKNNKYLSLAIFCQIICIYSSGNGIIAAFVLVIFTIFDGEKIKIILSSLTFIIFSSLYYFHYTRVADESTYTHDLSKILPFFFHMTGGHFGYENGILIGVILLVVLVLALPVSKNLRIKQNTLPLLCIVFYFLASNGVISIFRSNVKMLDSYSSRYLINPNIITAIIFVLLFIKLEVYKYKWQIVIPVCILLLYTYSQNYTYGEAGFARYKARTQGQEYYFPIERAAEAKSIATQSCTLGIYCIQDER